MDASAGVGHHHHVSTASSTSMASTSGPPRSMSTPSGLDLRSSMPVSAAFQPLTLNSVLTEHQHNAAHALQSLLNRYNHLLSSAHAVETEQVRRQEENSKLWNIISNLKKERDSVMREHDRSTRDRNRQTKRIMELEKLCLTNNLPLPECKEEDTDPTKSTRSIPVRRPPGGASNSNSRSVRQPSNTSTGTTTNSTALSSSSNTKPLSQATTESEGVPFPSRGEWYASPPSSAVEPTFPRDIHATPLPAILRRKASSVDLGNPAASVPAAVLQSPVSLTRSPPLDVATAHSFSDPVPPDSTSQDSHATPKQDAAKMYNLSSIVIQSSPFAPLFPSSSPAPSTSSNTAQSAVSDPGSQASNVPSTSATQLASAPSSNRSGTRLETIPQGDSPEIDRTDVAQLRERNMHTPTMDAQSLLPEFNTPQSERGRSMDIQTDKYSITSSPVKHQLVKEHGHRHATAPSMPYSTSISSLASSSVTQSPPPAQRHDSASRLIRLTPSLLMNTQVQVINSQIRTNDKSREIISFSIRVSVDIEEKKISQQWVIEKRYSDILTLDAAVRSKNPKTQHRKLAAVPEKSLFKDHAPTKVDMRKAALQRYLSTLVATPLTNRTEVCAFLQTNLVIDRLMPTANPAFKAGYLTKKGRIIKNWQTRYYVLRGPLLEYYDGPGGNQLGHIDVTGAQIGRQQSQKENTMIGDTYRHAFLIREVRATHEQVDHILCAESDEERDEWVNVLASWFTGEYIQSVEIPAAPSTSTKTSTSTSATVTPDKRSATEALPPPNVQRRAGRKLSKDDISKTNAQPLSNMQPDANNRKLFVTAPLPDTQNHKRGDSNHSAVGHSHDPPVVGSAPNTRFVTNRRFEAEMSASSSLPSNLDTLASDRPSQNTPFVRPSSEQGHHPDVPTASSSGHRPISPDKRLNMISAPMNGAPIGAGFKASRQEERRAKTKSSFWNFAMRAEKHPAVVAAPRPVFGVPLQEAVNVARIREGFDLPAVVFRCVEYLEDKGAEKEEGLYRLSGSSAVIKALKERFNQEGDVNLLATGEYFDPHAVAGLLKLFLRELPVHVLTKELQQSFMQVCDLANRKDKVNELGFLVAKMPIANYTLLRFLTAHLIHVVANEATNKMTLRNVGIVFSPTLNMPAPLFNLFLTEFDHVFNFEEDQPAPLRITDEEAVAEQSPALDKADKRRSRNSVYYTRSGADTLLENGASLKGPEEEEEDAEEEFADADDDSGDTSPSHSPLPSTPSSNLTGHTHASDYLDVKQEHSYQRNASTKGLAIQIPKQQEERVKVDSPTQTIRIPPSPRVGLPSSPRANLPTA